MKPNNHNITIIFQLFVIYQRTFFKQLLEQWVYTRVFTSHVHEGQIKVQSIITCSHYPGFQVQLCASYLCLCGNCDFFFPLCSMLLPTYFFRLAFLCSWLLYLDLAFKKYISAFFSYIWLFCLSLIPIHQTVSACCAFLFEMCGLFCLIFFLQRRFFLKKKLSYSLQIIKMHGFTFALELTWLVFFTRDVPHEWMFTFFNQYFPSVF